MHWYLIKICSQVSPQFSYGSFMASLDGLAATVQFFTDRYQALAFSVNATQ